MANAFDEYLKNLCDDRPVKDVVLGNSACDLDSIASSIVYAYILTYSGKPSIPVLCINHGDIKLRTEVIYFLDLLGIHQNDLVYLDSPVLNRLRSAHVNVHLVDHNRYDNSLLSLQSYQVSSIIDHHVDEGSTCEGIKVIEMVGSCCTLVAELLLKQSDVPITDNLKRLLAGTILLDTINLDFEKGRTTKKDCDVFDQLAVPKREDIYTGLIAAKTDISNLSVYDLLRRDCKDFITGGDRRVFISSVTGASWKQFVEMPNMTIDVDQYVTANSIDILILMLASHSPEGKFQRQLVLAHGRGVFIFIPGFIEKICQELELQEIPENITEWMIFDQLDVKSSRKIVMPLVKSLLEQNDL